MLSRTAILLFTVVLILYVVDCQEEKGADSQKGKKQKGKNPKKQKGKGKKAINDLMNSVNDAKAEMEKVQRSIEENNKELDTKLSQQMEELSTKFFEQLAVMNDKLSDSDDITNTKLDELRDEASKISDVASSATSGLDDLTAKISDVASSATSEIKDLTAKISDVASSATSGLDDLTSKISDVESVAGKWPSGSYCIFRSGGTCPSGFTAYSGYAKDLYQYYPSHSNYMSAVTFGDSSLGCEGSCKSGYEYVDDTNLVINACCK